MKLNKNIFFDGMTQEGAFRFYAFVGDTIERLRVFDSCKSKAIQAANNYFKQYKLKG